MPADKLILVAIFAFSLFLLADKRMPKLRLVIPLLWAIGGIIPRSVGIYEDIGRILSGVLGTIMTLYRDWKAQVLQTRLPEQKTPRPIHQ
jgi:hypothetical protein